MSALGWWLALLVTIVTSVIVGRSVGFVTTVVVASAAGALVAWLVDEILNRRGSW